MDRIYPLFNFNINVNIFLPDKAKEPINKRNKKGRGKDKKELVLKTNKM